MSWLCPDHALVCLGHVLAPLPPAFAGAKQQPLGEQLDDDEEQQQSSLPEDGSGDDDDDGDNEEGDEEDEVEEGEEGDGESEPSTDSGDPIGAHAAGLLNGLRSDKVSKEREREGEGAVGHDWGMPWMSWQLDARTWPRLGRKCFHDLWQRLEAFA